MKTVVTKSILKAAQFIKKGGVVAFPTETVYGLGANALNEKAVAKIFRAKGRPADNPLIVHISDFSQLALITKKISTQAKTLMDAFFPGPLTIVLPKSENIPANVSAGLPTVGVRMPSLKLARDFIRLSGFPLAAPSANISGSPSATTYQDVLQDFKGRIPCVLQGLASSFGLESSVIDCSVKRPKILRLGAITQKQLEDVLGFKLSKARKHQKIKSPGMKYRHYSPKAKVVPFTCLDQIQPNQKTALIGLQAAPKNKSVAYFKRCSTTAIYARSLYRFFRECDARGIKVIYCEIPTDHDLGAALRDRLLKASSPN